MTNIEILEYIKFNPKQIQDWESCKLGFNVCRKLQIKRHEN